MNAEHFGLKGNPFGPSEAFWAHPERLEAIDRLLDALRLRQVLVLVTGPAGVGKTMLSREMASLLDRNRTATVMLCADPASTADFVERIEKKRAATPDPLAGLPGGGRPTVLIVDQAETLADDELLRFVRLNQVPPKGADPVKILLIGSVELVNRLKQPALRPVMKALTFHADLYPLSPCDVSAYIAFRIRAAGGPGRLGFDPAAMAWIAAQSEGCPGRIDALCTAALQAAVRHNVTRITAALLKSLAYGDEPAPDAPRRDVPARSVPANARNTGGEIRSRSMEKVLRNLHDELDGKCAGLRKRGRPSNLPPSIPVPVVSDPAPRRRRGRALTLAATLIGSVTVGAVIVLDRQPDILVSSAIMPGDWTPQAVNAALQLVADAGARPAQASPDEAPVHGAMPDDTLDNDASAIPLTSAAAAEEPPEQPEPRPQETAGVDDAPAPDETETAEAPDPRMIWVTPQEAPVSETAAPEEDGPEEAGPEDAAPEEAAGIEPPEDAALPPPEPEPPPAMAPPPAPDRPAPPSPSVAALLERGDHMLELGDIAAARLFYETAALRGSARAATAAGMTYDPLHLREMSVHGVAPDPSRAADWYEQAIELGDPRAEQHLQALTRTTGR